MCVVKFQAFRGDDNEFAVQELVVVAVRVNAPPDVVLFKPPYVRSALCKQVLKTAYWLEHHISGSHGGDDEVDYEVMQTIIEYMCSRFATVYTRGLEKVTFLQYFHGNVFDLKAIVAPKYGTLSFTNSVHYHVAKHNVYTRSRYRGSYGESDVNVYAFKRAYCYAL